MAQLQGQLKQEYLAFVQEIRMTGDLQADSDQDDSDHGKSLPLNNEQLKALGLNQEMFEHTLSQFKDT